jgi:hypothetical protein
MKQYLEDLHVVSRDPLQAWLAEHGDSAAQCGRAEVLYFLSLVFDSIPRRLKCLELMNLMLMGLMLS